MNVNIMPLKESSKLKPIYIGPCRIKRQNLNSKIVFIAEVNKGVTKTLNRGMLAPWFERLKK